MGPVNSKLTMIIYYCLHFQSFVIKYIDVSDVINESITIYNIISIFCTQTVIKYFTCFLKLYSVVKIYAYFTISSDWRSLLLPRLTYITVVCTNKGKNFFGKVLNRVTILLYSKMENNVKIQGLLYFPYIKNVYRLDLATRSNSSFFLIAYEFDEPLAALISSSAKHSPIVLMLRKAASLAPVHSNQIAWLTRRNGDTSTACLLTVPARPIRVESSLGPELMMAVTRTCGTSIPINSDINCTIV